MKYDLAIVGSGIVGLGHALAAVRRGLRVVVIERDARPIGASIRNFGFVTVTGQRRGATWRRALRSAAIWEEVAPQAGISLEHRGLALLARRPEARAVLDAFLATEMGERCAILSATEALDRYPDLNPETLDCALWSPHELRVESADAIPRLVAWLEREGVTFRFGAAVHDVSPPHIATSRGEILAEAAVVCPGDDFVTLFPDVIAPARATRCLLQMLRLESPGFRLPAAIMSDLSLVRYRGYADLPESAALRQRLTREQGAHLAAGVHLIVVQSADGSLVVGDSHVYHDAPEPFAPAAFERLILDELHATIGVAPEVRARWTGVYASAEDDVFIAAPSAAVRIAIVTSGTGASTAFALGEETIAELFGAERAAKRAVGG